MRKPFQYWSLENFVGLLLFAAHALVVLLIMALCGLLIWSIFADPEPKQRMMTETVMQGDVKYLCVEARTGSHVDAMSCELIDPHTGGVMR